MLKHSMLCPSTQYSYAAGITESARFCDSRKDESEKIEARLVVFSTTSLNSEWKVGTCMTGVNGGSG